MATDCLEPSTVSTRVQTGWPAPLAPEARYGLAGRILDAIEPHTETDPAAILGQLLMAVGNIVGRIPHFRVEATRHYLKLFVALVGDTSKARKGTSWDQVSRLFEMAEPTRKRGVATRWRDRLVSGLSSGEGLICAVRDVDIEDEEEFSSGITDKRRIVIEPELASTLKVLRREGNTLSAIVRSAWDSGDLQTLTKNMPLRATDSHVSIVGHITRDELRRELTATEQGNGFANRFLWFCVKRSKLLPEGGSLQDDDLRPLAEELQVVFDFAAQEVREMTRDGEARDFWREVYTALSRGEAGLVGAVIARGEAQVMRLACIYALLDWTATVRVEHLKAAVAVWRYCEDSARYIFGRATGNPVADQILRSLRESDDGMTRTEIRDLFSRNRTKEQIDAALEDLERCGLARSEKDAEEIGRPTERWFAIQVTTETTKTTDDENAAAQSVV